MYEPSIKWFSKPFEHVCEHICVIAWRDHTSQNEWLNSSNTSSGYKVLLRGLNYSISLNSSETPNKMSTWELNVEKGCICPSWYLHMQILKFTGKSEPWRSLSSPVNFNIYLVKCAHTKEDSKAIVSSVPLCLRNGFINLNSLVHRMLSCP